MRSTVTVTTPAQFTALTSLEAARTELGLTDASQDARLQQLIGRASAAARSYLARDLSYAGLTQVLRRELGDSVDQAPEALLLARWPVEDVTSVTLDGEVLDDDEYEIDAASGLLYRLDGNASPCTWRICDSCSVVFGGGYRMPGDALRNLPEDIEAGALALIRGQYFATGRDPALKQVDIPGVMSQTLWVGGEGTKSGLPAIVESYWAPYRREL